MGILQEFQLRLGQGADHRNGSGSGERQNVRSELLSQAQFMLKSEGRKVSAAVDTTLLAVTRFTPDSSSGSGGGAAPLAYAVTQMVSAFHMDVYLQV